MDIYLENIKLQIKLDDNGYLEKNKKFFEWLNESYLENSNIEKYYSRFDWEHDYNQEYYEYTKHRNRDELLLINLNKNEFLTMPVRIYIDIVFSTCNKKEREAQGVYIEPGAESLTLWLGEKENIDFQNDPSVKLKLDGNDMYKIYPFNKEKDVFKEFEYLNRSDILDIKENIIAKNNYQQMKKQEVSLETKIHEFEDEFVYKNIEIKRNDEQQMLDIELHVSEKQEYEDRILYQTRVNKKIHLKDFLQDEYLLEMCQLPT